jgi:hypothetical protein
MQLYTLQYDGVADAAFRSAATAAAAATGVTVDEHGADDSDGIGDDAAARERRKRRRTPLDLRSVQGLTETGKSCGSRALFHFVLFLYAFLERAVCTEWQRPASLGCALNPFTSFHFFSFVHGLAETCKVCAGASATACLLRVHSVSSSLVSLRLVLHSVQGLTETGNFCIFFFHVISVFILFLKSARSKFTINRLQHVTQHI